MSKRDLKKYLTELHKKQLEEQILELYEKFSAVKTYYDFVFNPNERNLIKDAKLKISNEYFPVRGKKPKMRRSIAQKFIKHFISLGVDAFIIADIMLYNIEIAQALSSEKQINNQAFYKSMLNSFEQTISFMIEKGIFDHFKSRVVVIKDETIKQNWINKYEFNAIVDRFDY
jgi:putative NIF3 family GTP cyclohydrolase 1 type 2